MQSDNEHNALDATHSNPTWRSPQTTKRRIVKRPHPPKRSDLGSDEEWQPPMGSDSEVDEPEPSVTNPPVTDSSVHVGPDNKHHDKPDNDDNVNKPNVTTSPESSSHQPGQTVNETPKYLSPDYVATGFDKALHISKSHTPSLLPPSMDEALLKAITSESHESNSQADTDADDADDHRIILPGYRGVTSRAAIANHPVTTIDETAQSTSTWSDRPRGNPVPLLSSQPAADNNSAPSSPGLMQTPSRVESDSAPGPLRGSPGSATAPHVLRPAPLKPLDESHEVPVKPVLPTAQSISKSSLKTAVQGAADPKPPSSGMTTDPVKMDTRKTLGIRSTLRDSRARLYAARLPGSKRNQRRLSRAGDASLQGAVENSTSATESQRDPAVLPPLPSAPQYLVGESSASRTLSNQRLSTRSDGAFPRPNPELLQDSPPGGRPLSTPLYLANFDSPTTSQVTGSTAGAGSAYPIASGTALPIQSRRRGLQAASAPRKDLSFLDCVAEVLKGTDAARRKSFMNVHEGRMWLTPDMQAVQYRMGKKGQLPETQSLILARVRKVKGVERELSIEIIDQKKPVEFLFQSKDRADMWLSALCCLVPSHATVKVRHRKLEMRETYDPLADTWNGKPVAFRKKLKQLIILGSIGRGSFSKVKLALSEGDRQFYAVKILPKVSIRKHKLGIPMDRSLPHAAASTPVNIGDVHEVVVMKALNHENVIKLKGVFDDTEEDRLYIVLEYLARGPVISSGQAAGEKPITENEARSAFVDILGGLQYLHRNGIVHRDIKPDNLLQAGDGTVKISDFGAALVYAADDRIEADGGLPYDSLCGTPAFCAPEFCVSEKSPPRPSRCYGADIWALGATLFYMVYGCIPFRRDGLFPTFDAICTQELVFPDTPAVSDNLKDLIRQMLKKRPEDRATITSIIQSPWLTQSLETADRLAKIRSALHEQSNGTSEERRWGHPTS